jgi:hypothetical protein
MAGNLYTQLAKVLHRAPDLRARCAELFGDALAADDDGRVVAQQTHDAAETRVGRAIIGAGWRDAGDRKIMREAAENG